MLSMKSKCIEFCPEEVVGLLARLGARIRTARIRRKWRQEDLAAKTNLSRSTIQSIERGELTCSIGSVFHVLWVLGLSNEIDLIADAGLDRDGLALSLSENNLRVYVPRKINNDF